MRHIQELIEKELNIKNQKLYPILDITEPILVAMESEDKWYLIYLLQHRRLLRESQDGVPVIEILVSSSDLNTIKRVASGNFPIRKALLSEEVYRIGKISNKIYNKTLVEDEDYINDKIPKEDFCLEPLVPNRIDIDELIDELNSL